MKHFHLSFKVPLRAIARHGCVVTLPLEVLMFMKVYGWREVMDGWVWDIHWSTREDRYNIGIGIMLALSVYMY